MAATADFEGVWFHFIETVYGAWLYGDQRGFRTRHHREHVEGDYKNPPTPGLHDEKLQRSRSLLNRNPSSSHRIGGPSSAMPSAND